SRCPPRHVPALPEGAARRKLLCLVDGVEAVSGLDLYRRHALGDQGIEPRQRRFDEGILACLSRGANRGNNATAGSRDVFIARAGEALLEFARTMTPEDKMGVAIDQTWRKQAAFAIDALRGVDSAEVAAGSGKDDASVHLGDGAAIHQSEAGLVWRQCRQPRVVKEPTYAHCQVTLHDYTCLYIQGKATVSSIQGA